MSQTKYYINLSDEVIILREKKRDEKHVNTDVLFTTATSIKFNTLDDGSFNVGAGHWDHSFREPYGIKDKKIILRYVGT